MRELLITTGHNSSVILIEDGVLQWGYETERLTGTKSDSRFPLDFLPQHGISIGKIDLAYVTHWSPDGRLGSMSHKHWQPEQLSGVPVHTLDVMAGRSHHDTHMAAAIRYADTNERFPRTSTYGLVVDGFGTVGEHFSLYKIDEHGMRLLRRYHGYETSLGLFYQYTTAFLGMKMHEDEYKLLGYQVHCPQRLADGIRMRAIVDALRWYEAMHKSPYGSQYDPMYDVKALANVKAAIFSRLTELCKTYRIDDPHSFEGRAAIAHYAQTLLETVVQNVLHSEVKSFEYYNLIVSGGVFYNVKLNNVLINRMITTGKFCAYPLAGDQGCAIGLYAMANPQWQHPKNLFWGRRVLRNVGHVQNLTYCDSEADAADVVCDRLKKFGYVNIVRGGMEFGPRALCNTSTLALPTLANVRRINEMNCRNTVMPMAPVLSQYDYNLRFDRTYVLWESQKHMIVALDYAQRPSDDELGVAHSYPDTERWTGRPQVADPSDEFLQSALGAFNGILINTSFNFHGVPIAFDMPSVVNNHMMEFDRDQTISTVVVTNDGQP